MSTWWNPFGWGGQKYFNSNLKSMKGVPRDTSHPEQHKNRSALQANIDAASLHVNNDLIASYVKALQSGVAGTGFTLQYKSDSAELNKEVETWLSYWSEYKNCEITGRFFRQDFERFLVSEAAIKGGFIIRHHNDKRIETLYNVEVMSTDTIDRTKCDFVKGLYFGVQTNKLGQISGMYLYKDAQRTESKLNSMKNLILFTDVWTDPHQYTNVTPLAPILNTLDKLATYTNAEVKGAKGRADKSIIVASEAYTIMLKAQEEYMTKVLKEKGDDSPDYAQAQEEYSELVSQFSVQGLHNGAVPIMPGENTQVWDLKQSGDTIYADISENSKQILSKALGLAPSTVAGLPESSYNVALKNAQSDEREYAIVGQKIIEKVLKTVYRNAIEAGYLLGYYDIPNFYSMERKEKIKYNGYLKITRKEIGHIDPLKQNLGDALAKEEEFNSTPAIVAARGGDAEEILNDELRYQLMVKEKYEKAGLVYIQPGTEKLALEKTKKEVTKQDEEENKTSEKGNR